MSISPQSLAKTRDKRSLRMPSRFNDFREIPTEVAYRDAAEALNLKGKEKSIPIQEVIELPKDKHITNLPRKTSSSSKSRRKSSSVRRSSKKAKPRHGDEPVFVTGEQSNSSNSSHEKSKNTTPDVDDTFDCNEKTNEAEIKPGRSSDSSEATSLLYSSKDSIELATEIKTGDTTVNPEPCVKSEPQLEVQVLPTPTPTQQPVSKSPKTPKESPQHQQPSQPATKQKIADYSRGKADTTNCLSDPQLDDISLKLKNTTVERLDLSIDKKTTTKSSSRVKRDKADGDEADDGNQDDVIKIWKGTFHPSIMVRKQKQKNVDDNKPIENQLATAQQLPLVEQKPNWPFISIGAPQGSILKSSLTPSRKKSKGFSLMVKPSRPQPSQQQQNQQILQTSIQTGNNYKLAQQSQYIYPQAKQINNFTTQPSLHYGTRLLFNEPIYLPRSVGPIAPITATLQQIAAQARRPPFLSKKYEACMNYQSELGFNFMTSMHETLVRIVKQLGFKDRMNLRCVSKAWKSVIDCDTVWSKVTLTRDDSNIELISCIEFLKYRTKEIIFDNYGSDIRDCEEIRDKLLVFFDGMEKLEKIFIRSADAEHNSIAVIILESGLRSKRGATQRNQGSISWCVKIEVDPQGVANIPMAMDNDTIEDGEDYSIVYEDFWELEELLVKRFESTRETQNSVEESSKFSRIHMTPI